jgi:hypothetical protein
MKAATVCEYYKIRKRSGMECGVKAKLDEISSMALYIQHCHDPLMNLYICSKCGFIHMGKKKFSTREKI